MQFLGFQLKIRLEFSRNILKLYEKGSVYRLRLQTFHFNMLKNSQFEDLRSSAEMLPNILTAVLFLQFEINQKFAF